MQYVDEMVYEYDDDEDLPGAGRGSGLGVGARGADSEVDASCCTQTSYLLSIIYDYASPLFRTE